MIRTLKRLLPNDHPLRLLWHRSNAFAAALRYGFPARHLTVIGITGTDGKTTTVGMAAHILHEHGIAVGALSTAFFRIRDRIEWNETQKTSPSPFIIQQFLRRLVTEGCTHAVLEYSSHGLMQSRMNWTWPTVAGITNVSEEHLDYHGTMERYTAAKGMLFNMLRTKNGTKVLNADDRSAPLLQTLHSHSTVSYSPAQQLHNIQATPSSCTAIVQSDDESFPLTLPLPGTFNLSNALCAIFCVSAASSIPPRNAASSLQHFTGIPGRMERIDAGQPFSVFVDFTVTPASYERTLSTLKELLPAGKRLLVLAGSCGDRMKEKRPIVGRIVSHYANGLVITNEDPYTEDPERIISDVWAGVDPAHPSARRITDRREAILFLLQEARPGDIVILCGKGSDTTMWVKEGQIPWNEREIVREMLKKMEN